MDKLYLVGKLIDYDLKAWEFAGLFSTEEKAIENCFDESYFLAEVEVDKIIPVETHDFNYAYYPKTQDKPKRQ